MSTLTVRTKRTTAILAAASLLAFGLVFVGGEAASADTPLPSPATILQPDANVVSADALPTIQIDKGYVWAQTIVGDTVYAAGSFANARQAGTAPGGGALTTRTNILAYNITTGALTSFAPAVNGVIKGIAASPDGSRIYIGGSFNTVNGQARYNVAAVDAITGALVPGFAPSVGGTGIYSMVATANALYVGGLFSQGNATARRNLAAFSTSNGALLGWAPTTDLQVDAMVMDPSNAKVIIGGRFAGVNGVTQRGLAALDLTNGSILPWAAPATIINGASTGANAGKAGIFGLSADANGVYGTGWVYADVATGNLEGVFAAEAGTGDIRWVADCHGDEYGVFSTGSVVYTTSHTHQCDTVGLAPELNPRTYRYVSAFTAAPGGILTRSPSVSDIYKDWSGTVSPSPYAWYPDFTVGNTSGLGQAGLSITGNSQYISVGGEFGSVNNRQFSGLVRFGVNPAGGAKMGPRLAGDTWTGGTAISKSAGTVRVTIPANWDRDDLHLTYSLYRTGVAAPVATLVADSTWWNMPPVTLKDTGLTPGSSQTYRVTATDDDGNTVSSNLITATVASGTPSAYGDRVLDDNASLFWRLGDDASDWAGGANPVFGSGVSSVSPGPVVTDATNTASAFNGTSTGRVSTSTTKTVGTSLSVEAWIKTTTTSGGKIVGYGSSQTGDSSSYDRHLYMQNNGRVTFGVYDGATRTATSTSALNDGAWHQVVGTMSPSEGIKLYVDGVLVSTDPAGTSAQAYSGYWRVGGDNLGGWPNQPSKSTFTGQIDEVSVYGTALTPGAISQQYDLAQGNVSPTAAFTATPTNLAVSVDGTASTAPAGRSIASYSWTWGDGTPAGSGATASHIYASAGTYQQTLTVTDSTGRIGEITKPVTVVAPNVVPTAAFSSSTSGLQLAVDGRTSSDSDGTIASYSWNWGDATVAGTGSTATHSYAAPGNYTLVLTVTDDQGGTDTSTASIEVTHVAPVASFTNAVSGLGVSVDAAASSASDGATLSYSWNWGDGTPAGSGRTASHTYAAGGSYTVVLTVTDSLAATATTSTVVAPVAPVHTPPVASFTNAVSGLGVSVDAAASSASDGATLSYSWNWGDGTPAGSGRTASHTYAAGGSYTVVLTVTDSLAATATTSTVVAPVAPVHTPPVASFTNAVSGLGVSVDAAASSASDGATLSYSWNWGDGTPAGSGRTASHTYAAGGSYTVVLTVTDSLAATATTSAPITVTDPVPSATVAADAFGRSVASGWGSADTGGAYSVVSGAASAASVSGGAGVLALTPSNTRSVMLTAAKAQDTTTSVVFSLDAAPATGSAYAGVIARQMTNAADNYTTRVWLNANGTVWLVIQRGGTVLQSLQLPGITRAAGDSFNLKVNVTGTSPTTIAAKVWRVGTAEPTSAQLTVTDSTAVLQGSGYVGLHGARAGSATTTGKITFDNYVVTNAGSIVPPPNVAPTAAFSSSSSDLTASVDASGSVDSDGTISSYSWNWGDGTAAGAGATATHGYAAAGTYQVVLTVTDNGGLTGTVTRSVTVTDPVPSATVAADAFGRSVASGWGSADTGGAYSVVSGAASAASVSGGAGVLALTPSNTRSVMLTAAKAQDTTTSVVFSLDAAPATGSAYAGVIARQMTNAADNYTTRVWLNANGTVWLVIQRGGTVLQSLQLPGITRAAGDSFNLKVNVTGTSPTTIAAKVWRVGTAEPTSAQLTVTDSTAVLQGSGYVGLHGARAGSATTTGKITFDNYVVTKLG